ncbi:hypothetical protein L6R46_11085 [Myxococcota bacterium]|nr:hypothetical protein [Myxococcota bacterium]
MLLLNQLRFSGYRSFRGQLGDDWDQASSLPLRRLTLVVGMNGTGKSQALRLLHQVLASLGEPGGPLFSSRAGGRTFANSDVANFHKMSPVANPLRVALSWTFNRVPGELRFTIIGEPGSPTPLRVARWTLKQGEDEAQGEDTPPPWRDGRWSAVHAALVDLGRRGEALQGVRARLARDYPSFPEGGLRPSLGLDGAGAPMWLSHSPEVLRRTNRWFREHLPVRIELDNSQGGMRLLERAGRAPINLAEAAEGIHQALPVVTMLSARALEQAPQVDLLEQPELHLHDAMQPALGDLLLDAVGLGVERSTHDMGQRLLVETHSEGVLLRIRRRIAEGSVQPSDIGLRYAERVNGENILREIELDERGQLSWWPDGVFLERLQEAKAIAVAMRRR